MGSVAHNRAFFVHQTADRGLSRRGQCQTDDAGAGRCHRAARRYHDPSADGNWTPDTTTYQALLADDGEASARPYPFALAHPLDRLDDLGPATDWAAEWKWDGIRGQLILRGRTPHLWSRGEDLLTDRFPELGQIADFLPQRIVIDGEVLAYADNQPLPFGARKPGSPANRPGANYWPKCR